MSHNHLADAARALRELDASLPLRERTPAELTTYADAKTSLATAYALQGLAKSLSDIATVLRAQLDQEGE